MRDRGRVVERTCAGCERQFLARARRVKSGQGRFCSVTCSVVHAQKCWSEQATPRAPRVCETCRKTFDNYEGQFCSRQCWRDRPRQGAAERFWAKVHRRGPADCWPWMAYIATNGYGQFVAKELGGHVAAHRFAYMVAKGPIPEGLFVCHTCDNRRCVNPAHLYAGTALDNMRDAKERGRLWTGPRPYRPRPSRRRQVSLVVEEPQPTVGDSDFPARAATSCTHPDHPATTEQEGR